MTTFGEAEDGTLYLATMSGSIFKIFQSNVVALQLHSFDGYTANGKDNLYWRITADPAIVKFEVEQSLNSTAFHTAGEIPAGSGQTHYSFTVPAVPGNRYYRLKIINGNGTATYSAVKKLTGGQQEDIVISSIHQGNIRLRNTVFLEKVNLLNALGQILRTYSNLSAGTHLLPTTGIRPGVYFLQCMNNKRDSKTLRIVLR
ncbi:MAG: hypothetical protein WKF88_05900 [Ferruginibacter sp.]